MEINKYIEHTNLKAYATEEDIRKLCQEAIDYGFQAVVVNPHYVPFVKDLLNGTNIEIGTVVGFPLGANTIETKVYETIDAIEKGATEIDMVANIGAIKDGDFEYVKKEIEEVHYSCDGKPLKVIIETCYLTKEEIKKMTEICNETFVELIKTSTLLCFTTNLADMKSDVLKGRKIIPLTDPEADVTYHLIYKK